MKKIFFGSLLLGALFTACSNDDDYNAGIANPQASDPTVTHSFGNGKVTEVGVINLAEITEETVKVADIVTPTMTSETAKLDSMCISILELEEDHITRISTDGTISKDYLASKLQLLYGMRPLEREITAVLSAFLSDGNQAFLINSDAFSIKAVPASPDIEAAYYFTGTLNGWDNTNTDYKLTNDGSDPYENPVYTCRIPAPEDGSDVMFKMTPESGLGGDWSGCLSGSTTDGTFDYNNTGGDLVIPAVEGAVFYDLTFNMLDLTWSFTPLFINIEPAYYFTGTLNGWNNNDTSYKLTNNGGDPYENPTFTCRIPAPEDGSDVMFKMTPESGLGGDWSGCLAGGGSDGTFVYNNGGGDLFIQAVEGAKFYDLTFNMMELTWSYRAVTFDPYVYFIGATDGWAASDQKLAATEDGVYSGYLYVADPNGWGLEFKFQLEPGNWDKQLNSQNLAEISGDFEKGDDNIKASAGEGVYYVNLDLNTNVLNATKITNMNLVGDFNSWSPNDDAQQMTWDAENYCYVITGAGVNANGWKFTANNAWDINLGANDTVEPSSVIDDLVGFGKNLNAVGTTIKLYPTRKTSDKIYCTVE